VHLAGNRRKGARLFGVTLDELDLVFGVGCELVDRDDALKTVQLIEAMTISDESEASKKPRPTALVPKKMASKMMSAFGGPNATRCRTCL
jgi:hypothetical protein